MKRVGKNNRFYILSAFIVAFSLVFAALGITKLFKNVNAANLAEFDAGYIISDSQMSNYNSMSEAEIQAFLSSKNSCNNTNYGQYQYLEATYGSYDWHWNNGHFVCLSEELFGDGEAIGYGETAAHIIWQAAQDYRINPQALIVLLQKETGLITDTYPNNGDYRKATGYGCPDTAPCSSEYYGLKNQIRHAAALFRTVLDGGWTNYPLGDNYVKYNPNSDCGGTVVNIRSLATSALYRYTPYQPNAAALFGSGDVCSAYGNMNFFSLFSDWFGNPKAETGPQAVRLPDGEYSIHSLVNHNMVFDIADNGVENGTNIQLWEENRTEAQKWRLEYQGNSDSFVIKNPNSGKVLDLSAGDTRNGTNIQLWEYNGSCAQLWKIMKSGDDYSIHSACASYLVVDLKGANAINTGNIQLWSSNSTAAQQWDFVPFEQINEGTYEIYSNITKNKNIDISGNSDDNGSNIQIWDNNGTLAQKWKIENVGNGNYKITNPFNRKVLDVAAAGKENSTNVQLWEYNGTCAQLWKIMKSGDSYIFISTCSGKVLDVAAAGKENGTNVQLWEYNSTSAQKWKFAKSKTIEDGTYEILSKLDTNKVLDVAAANTHDGTNIQLWHSNNTDAQKWEIKYHSEIDYYTISSLISGKVIDVAAANTHDGTNIQLWHANNTCAQYWKIIDSGGSYTIKSACSGSLIDVAAANTHDGANIQLWHSNNTDAQKWIFEK